MTSPGRVGPVAEDLVELPDAAMGAISDSYAQMAGGLYRLLTLGMRYYRRIGLPPESEAAAAPAPEARTPKRWITATARCHNRRGRITMGVSAPDTM